MYKVFDPLKIIFDMTKVLSENTEGFIKSLDIQCYNGIYIGELVLLDEYDNQILKAKISSTGQITIE